MAPLVALLLSAWPAPGDSLAVLPLPPRVSSRRLKVVVDAGHGAPGNDGNTGCFGQHEKDVTLDTARELAARLEATGAFQVRLARDADLPSYQARLAAAEAWHADAIVSLHTDARGYATPWDPWGDATPCFHNEAEPGFAVLYSVDAGEDLVARRVELAHALSGRLREAGFPAYDGVDYGSLYRSDDEPGCWVDLRPRKQSVYVLRASTVPTVIVETHHALDSREVLRWLEPGTHDAFAAAVARALLDVAEARHVAWAR